MPGNLDFKCALITGGGGGIGKGIAEYFNNKGKKVLLVGRTEANLRRTAIDIGAAGYYVLDIGNTASIPGVVAHIIGQHPDLDCLVNNAGVQQPLDIINADPDDFLRRADQEIDINIRGPMHLTLTLLRHLQSKPSALVINVSSVLALLPFVPINASYSGTKSWLHFWTMNLRTMLQQTGSAIRVVEIVPPTVATDLHRERDNPDDNKTENNPESMTVQQFMDVVGDKFERGNETIGAGIAEDFLHRWYVAFGDEYEQRMGNGRSTM